MPYRPVYEKPRLILDWGTEQHERETHWTSLFYDLLLVAALNALAEPFEEFDDSGENTFEGDGLETNIGKKLEPIKLLWLDAMLQFFAVVNPWNTLNEFTSMFEDESLIGHLYFFLHCFGYSMTMQLPLPRFLPSSHSQLQSSSSLHKAKKSDPQTALQ